MIRKALAFLAVIAATLAISAPRRNKVSRCRRPRRSRARPRSRPDRCRGSKLTATDVDAWLDGFMPYALARGDIAGAVVVVVKDGQIADPARLSATPMSAKRTPVDPAHDPVPPRLDLQAVHLDRGHAAGRAGQARPRRRRQQYLDFKIPPYEGKPVTLRQHHDPHRRVRGAGQGPDHHRRKGRRRLTTSC